MNQPEKMSNPLADPRLLTKNKPGNWLSDDTGTQVKNPQMIKETSAVDLFTMMLNGKLKLFDKEVKAQLTSGVIYIPKRYVGRKVILIMENEK